MFWFIFFIIVCVTACYVCYKRGEIYGLHKAQVEFKHYLESHPNSEDLLGPGIDAAEHIINQIEEKDSL